MFASSNAGVRTPAPCASHPLRLLRPRAMRVGAMHLGALLAGFAFAAQVHAQQPAAPAWADVARVLQSPDVPSPGYHRFNFPRRDLTVHVGDVTVATAAALGGWVGFSGDPFNATMMGDLVLEASELPPVLKELAAQHIDVTAIHNHLIGESPRVMYVHVHGHGAAINLARGVDRAIALTGAPRPVTAVASPAVAMDTSGIRAALGVAPRVVGNVAQISYVLVPEEVLMDQQPLVPALAYASPVNVQEVSPSRWVATGDFAVTAGQLQPVLEALAVSGIPATAVHSHMVGEVPHVYFVHFWADGAPAAVLAGLRRTLDAARSVR